MEATNIETKYKVRMTLHRTTWHYFVENEAGGGFGSNHSGSKKVALYKAIRFLPLGTVFTLNVNDKVTTQIRTNGSTPCQEVK